MPHPIYGPPTHRLESVQAKLVLPRKNNGRIAQLVVTGEASTSRRSLWTYSEAWQEHQQGQMLQPTDTLHWLMLAVSQDQPVSQEGLQRCLLPGGWTDEPLPF